MNQMKGRLRVQSQSSVLAMACRERDAGLAQEVLAGRQSTQPLPQALLQALLALSRESSQPQLMEQLLAVMRDTGQALSVESVAELTEWAKRLAR